MYETRRGQPVELTPVNERKRQRYPAPRETQSGEQSLVDGFARLSQADARTGIRESGGTPVYPPYHEDL
jgi:hypothetical protein